MAGLDRGLDRRRRAAGRSAVDGLGRGASLDRRHHDQAHRGYDFASDATGYQSPNPLFFRYTPDANGNFAGQTCYGYQSIADFILGHRENLATIETTRNTTAILEAGRKSLDTGLRVEL